MNKQMCLSLSHLVCPSLGCWNKRKCWHICTHWTECELLLFAKKTSFFPLYTSDISSGDREDNSPVLCYFSILLRSLKWLWWFTGAVVNHSQALVFLQPFCSTRMLTWYFKYFLYHLPACPWGTIFIVSFPLGKTLFYYKRKIFDEAIELFWDLSDSILRGNNIQYIGLNVFMHTCCAHTHTS